MLDRHSQEDPNEEGKVRMFVLGRLPHEQAGGREKRMDRKTTLVITGTLVKRDWLVAWLFAEFNRSLRRSIRADVVDSRDSNESSRPLWRAPLLKEHHETVSCSSPAPCHRRR